MEIKEILDKFSDCDTFSLSMGITRHNKKNGVLPIPKYKITEEEYANAINELRNQAKSKPYNYHTDYEMSLIDELDNRKKLFLFNGKTDPKDEIPEQLKGSFIEYQVSFQNHVSVCYDLLRINYFFKLDEDSKKYLLEFDTDFDLKNFDDLTIYKNGEVKFYSNTHERYNTFEEL